MNHKNEEQRLRVERDNAVDDAKNCQEQIEVMHLRRENELRQMNDMGAEIERLRAGHCADCCCARSWKALGISEYTGKSIPEEITHLQELVIKNRDIATDLKYQLDDEVKENERLRTELEKVISLRDQLIATEEGKR